MTRISRSTRLSAAVIAAALLILALFAGIAVSGDVVIATVPVGMTPVAVGVNPVSHYAYVANFYASTLSVIDGTSHTVTATLTMPKANAAAAIPCAVVVDSVSATPTAYVANWQSHRVSVVDEATLTEVAAIMVPAINLGNPRALALDPSGGKLYVANYHEDVVSVIDLSSNTVISDVPAGSSPRALGIFVSAPRTRVYVVNRYSNDVTIIDGASDTVTATVAAGTAPKNVAVDPTTGYAYVTNEGSDDVTVIDDSDQVTATIPVGDRPIGVAVDESGGRVFVANFDDGTVSVIKTSDFTIEATVTVGTNPYSVAFDQGDDKAFVTNNGSSSVTIIPSSLVPTTVAVGTQPYAVACDEGASPHEAYVANWGSNNVSVIDEPAAPEMAMLGPLIAHAEATGPVATTVDALPGDETDSQTPSLTGTASSDRDPYAANVVAVFYRIDDAERWERAEITGGAGTESVTWRADVTGPLPVGEHTVRVVAVDQTGAAASSSEFGAGTTGAALGGNGAYAFSVVEPLALTSLSSYAAGAGTEITFTGTGFGDVQGASWVTFAGTPGGVVSWSATQVVATVPPGASAGYAGIVVDGVASNGLYFVPEDPPHVDSVDPGDGAAGSQVTLTGSGFGDTQGSGFPVFSGVVATVVSWSATEVVAIVPAGAEAGYAGIVQHGLTSNGVFFVPSSLPAIDALSSDYAFAGTEITVTGSNFREETGTLVIGGVPVPVLSWSDTEVVFEVPGDVDWGYVGVVQDGRTSNGKWLTIVPWVDALSTWWASEGDTITITGQGFGTETGRAIVAGQDMSVVSWSPTQVVAVVPAGAQSGYAGVVRGWATSNGRYLVVTEQAHVTGVDATWVTPGQLVTVTGTDFGPQLPTSWVAIGGTHVCETVTWSDTEIVARVPVGVTSGYLGVWKQGVPSNGVWVGVAGP